MKKIFSMFISLAFSISCYAQSDTLNRRDDNGLKAGKWVTTWEETGKVATIEYYKAGKKNGLCKYYDVNGRLQNEHEYMNDIIHGQGIVYYISGQKEVAEYKYGKREGMTRIYNYKGDLVEDYEYHNNMANGPHRVYYKSGRVMGEGTFINGAETGVRRKFADNDKKEVLIESEFVNDVRLERRFYKHGKLIKVEKDNPADTSYVPRG